MGFLGLSWFRSQQEKELENLEVEQSKIKLALLQSQLEKQKIKEEVTTTDFRPYKRLKLVNNSLTVILHDGSVYSKSGATEDDVNLVKTAKNEDDVLAVFTTKEYLKEKEEIQKTKDSVDILLKTGDFEELNGSLYMIANGKRINRSIPKLLINKFIDVVNDEEYNALKRFWLKCCMNPNARSAEDLYEFLSKHQFKIDKHGNFYAYRRVVSKNTQDKELVEFISNTYTKVKSVWKKKPSNYSVYEENELYGITENVSTLSFQNKNAEVIGNLERLYLDLPNMKENRYTDSHTRSYDYRVGEMYSMPRNEGNDDNTVSCSRGFHACNSKLYDYSSFGDTIVLMAINPMDVLSVPVGESGKLRTCRWFFAAVLGKDEEHILDEDDFDVLELGDIFEEKCQQNLEQYIQNSFAEEVKRHTFTLSNISSSEITNIVKSLELMKDEISNRVKSI